MVDLIFRIQNPVYGYSILTSKIEIVEAAFRSNWIVYSTSTNMYNGGHSKLNKTTKTINL